MQIEDYAGDTWENTPVFKITSDSQAAPQTFGEGATLSTTVPSLSTGVSTANVLTVSSALSESSSSDVSTVSSTLSESSSAPTSTASPTPQPSASNNSLSVAAKVVISVGSILCAIALMIVVLQYRKVRTRRQRGKEKDFNSTTPSPTNTDHTAEIGEGRSVYEVNGISRRPELYGTPRAELEGTTQST
jgi:peroxiredoxin